MDSVLNIVRQTVSKKKRRFREGDYDLDLTYIKPNLIAMGFPAEKLEGVYRNRIEDVVRFLEEKHQGHYKVYNLCSERKYDVAKFQSRVAHYPFDDHNPPRIELIEPFCEDVDSWIAKAPKNVAVIHCKAGKGRTGVMICAYLLHRKIMSSAVDALKFYDETRTSDHKGVTIPSQRRYVGYYDELLKAKARSKLSQYKETTLLLKGMRFHTIPHHSNLTPQIVIWKSSSSAESSTTKMYESQTISNAGKFEKEMCIEFVEKIPISGDTLVTVFNRPLMRKERMFQFWFNTYFVTDMEEPSSCSKNGTKAVDVCAKTTDDHKPPSFSIDPINRARSQKCVRVGTSFTFDVTNCVVLKLNKPDLDKANKDRSHKMFDPNFQVVCYFEKEAPKSASTASFATSTGRMNADSVDTLPSLPRRGREEFEDIGDENLSDTDTDTDNESLL